MRTYLVALLLAGAMLAWLLAGMAGTARELATVDPACADGRVYTEWCGCLPPVLGDDC